MENVERGQFISIIYNNRVYGAKVKSSTFATAYVEILDFEIERSIMKSDCFLTKQYAEDALKKRN